LTVLQGVLDGLGVAWEWAISTSASQAILNSVVEAIKKSDFVVGVLHDRDPRENVMLELGMDIGIGKPLLLLKAGETVVPSELSGFSLLATDLGDEKLLSFQLDLFLRSLEGKPSSKRAFAFPAQSAARIDASPPPELFESALEQSVAAAITKAGGRVTIPSRTGKERTPDLLMWLPQIDKDLFNPAAIEVVGDVSHADLETMQRRLASFIRSAGLRCGLIVVPRAIRSAAPEEFAVACARRSFASEGRPGPVTASTKLRQCSGTRFRSFFGKLIGKSLQADQYARAACDSMSRIVVLLSAPGSSVSNRAIASAVVESSSL